jgi:RNA-directed DNA polymerase
MKIKFEQTLQDIASLENLLQAWKEFLPGKKSKPDVQDFNLHLIDNILALRFDIVNGLYRHGGYQAFKISDPKPRDIHKASVRDRLLHHGIYRVLYPFFDRTFIADSYSCRIGKGTHRAIRRFDTFYRQVSRNNTRTVWVLKCDIRKFFASVDHGVLMGILKERIVDQKILDLLGEVVDSFSSTMAGVGLPLGNLTSQLLVNIYMNEFDQFVKHRLRVRHYIRYADDFVILSSNRDYLDIVLTEMRYFLLNRLRLNLHPDKVFVKTMASGVDFLGWVNFPDHKVIRTATKRRMIRRLDETTSEETVSSYRGLLRHGNAHKIVVSKFPPQLNLS